MIIKDIFLYFARFPKHEGLEAMFTMGASSFPEYGELQAALTSMQDCELVPDIDNYVYGQSLEDLQQRISRLFGSWLMVDYGEVAVSASGYAKPVTSTITQQLAVTVAMKMPTNHDMMERMIASDQTLDMLRRIFRHLWADSDNGRIDWLARASLQHAELVPFVASELNSYGWTLIFQTSVQDSFDTTGFIPSKEKAW